MSDWEKLKSFLEKLNIVQSEEDELPYLIDNVYVVKTRLQGNFSVEVRPEGYDGFFSEFTFDHNGNLLNWENFE